MKYLKINQDQNIVYPYSIDQLKIDNPNTSFPEKINKVTLSEYGIHQVIDVTKGSDYTKNYVETLPVLISNSYYQNWDITNASEKEINERIENKWLEIRSVRNMILSECDWTQLPDSPLSPEEKTKWSIYRQDLRDVTTQADPFNITWPIKP
jgi:hypothetical protein